MNDNKEKSYTIRVSKEIEKEISKYLKDENYLTTSEFIREAIREKLHGRTRSEEIDNNSKKNKLKKNKYFFEENKKLFNKLKEIEKNIK